MDRCGLLYGSREFTDECVFNEVMEDHYFNTYSSAKYSNEKRTLYLALNKKGIPRKVQTKPNASLDKLETYTNVLTKAVPPERVEALETKIYNARLLLGKFLLNSKDDHHSLRHHRYHQLCGNTPMVKSEDKNKFRCRKREKRKKKRKCRGDEDEDGEDCLPQKKKQQQHHPSKGMLKCEEGEEDDECQKRLHMIRKKRKSRNGDGDVPEKDKKRKKRLKKKFSEKSKVAKVRCENGETGNCGRRQEEVRGQKENDGEDYDADGFTDDPDPEEETAMDVVYDWTTSAAVQD
ncbi:UNVERIFIED_CONTAM: hypothetical protein PYX00_003611 [Menopon gallinae]|uniref:FGF n=1 Tax=Menopon gallinae TaxID=328185 RepID=A0AAW2I1A3_9NEOP